MPSRPRRAADGERPLSPAGRSATPTAPGRRPAGRRGSPAAAARRRRRAGRPSGTVAGRDEQFATSRTVWSSSVRVRAQSCGSSPSSRSKRPSASTGSSWRSAISRRVWWNTESGSARSASRVDGDVVRVHREPRDALGEARLVRVVPLHRRPGVVAAVRGQPGQDRRPASCPSADRLGVVVQRLDVAVGGDVDELRVRHPELLALVDVRRPAVQVQHARQRLRRGGPVLGRVVAEARHRPRLVVVVPVERVPADVGEADLPGLEVALERDEVERARARTSTRPGRGRGSRARR